MTYLNYFQDPNDMCDNPYFLEMYEREVICGEVHRAYVRGDIENEYDRETFSKRLWKGYMNWLQEYFSYEYEAFHE